LSAKSIPASSSAISSSKLFLERVRCAATRLRKTCFARRLRALDKAFELRSNPATASAPRQIEAAVSGNARQGELAGFGQAAAPRPGRRIPGSSESTTGDP